MRSTFAGKPCPPFRIGWPRAGDGAGTAASSPAGSTTSAATCRTVPVAAASCSVAAALGRSGARTTTLTTRTWATSPTWWRSHPCCRWALRPHRYGPPITPSSGRWLRGRSPTAARATSTWSRLCFPALDWLREPDGLRLDRPDVNGLVYNRVPNEASIRRTILPDDWPVHLWTLVSWLHDTGRIVAGGDCPLPVLLEPLQCYGGLGPDGRLRPPGVDVDFACQCYVPHDPSCPPGSRSTSWRTTALATRSPCGRAFGPGPHRRIRLVCGRCGLSCTSSTGDQPRSLSSMSSSTWGASMRTAVSLPCRSTPISTTSPVIGGTSPSTRTACPGR